MSIQDDPGILLFLNREMAVAICIEPPKDQFAGLSPAPVLINGCVESRNILFRQALSNLHLWVAVVIAPNEASDKANDDDCRRDRLLR